MHQDRSADSFFRFSLIPHHRATTVIPNHNNMVNAFEVAGKCDNVYRLTSPLSMYIVKCMEAFLLQQHVALHLDSIAVFLVTNSETAAVTP